VVAVLLLDGERLAESFLDQRFNSARTATSSEWPLLVLPGGI
jgi:hypothetical protein